MKLHISILFFVSTILFGSLSFAQVVPFENSKAISSFPKKDLSKVTLLLSGYHELGTQASFKKVSAAQDILIALSKGKESFIRDRALLALATYWVSSDVYLLMASLIANPETSFGTRIRMMVRFGERFQAKALPILQPYLSSSDPQIRISALQALQATNVDDAFVIINNHAKHEKSKIVLDAVNLYSARIR